MPAQTTRAAARIANGSHCLACFIVHAGRNAIVPVDAVRSLVVHWSFRRGKRLSCRSPLTTAIYLEGAIAMIVGVPKEIKRDEYRVAMLPVGVEELVRRGHQVLVEAGAGLGSGLPTTTTCKQGAEMVERPGGDLRPGRHDRQSQGAACRPRWPLMRKGQIVFTYFHFAADRELTEAMLDDRRDRRRLRNAGRRPAAGCRC